MADLNKCFLLGRLTRDPDLRGTPSGGKVCTLGLATSRKFNSNGQEKEETLFIDINVWGRQAENCGKYLAKGSQVLIEGRLRLDQWEDRNGGGKRSKIVVEAENVQFMGGRPEQQQQPQEQPPRRGVDSQYAPQPQMPDYDGADYSEDDNGDIPF